MFAHELIFQVATTADPETIVVNSITLKAQLLLSTPETVMVSTTNVLLVDEKLLGEFIVIASSQLVAAIYPAPCESGAVTVINVAAKTPPIPKMVKKIITIRSRLESKLVIYLPSKAGELRHFLSSEFLIAYNP